METNDEIKKNTMPSPKDLDVKAVDIAEKIKIESKVVDPIYENKMLEVKVISRKGIAGGLR